MIDGKRILVVVPARGGSKGIKLKNLRELNGTPLISIVGNIVSKIDFIDQAIVSTDHESIAQEAIKSGLKAPFFRPESLSGDRVGDVDVLTHALVEMEKLDGVKYDIIVMLQPTSPNRTVTDIKESIFKFIKTEADSLWTLSETDSKGHPFKQLIVNAEHIDFFDERGKKIIARQELNKTYHKNGIAYVMSRECLIDHQSIEGQKCIPYIINRYVANIDTELDFKIAEFLLSQEH